MHAHFREVTKYSIKHQHHFACICFECLNACMSFFNPIHARFIILFILIKKPLNVLIQA